MGATIVPAVSAGKTSFVETLTSGTSYTVPAGVTYVNVTLFGGGGGGGGVNGTATRASAGGTGGSTTFVGATSAPGGTGGTGNNKDTGGSGFNTSTLAFTELANSSAGGQGAEGDRDSTARALNGSSGSVIQSYVATTPAASITYAIGAGGTGGTGDVAGNTGGSGKIFIEYWV